MLLILLIAVANLSFSQYPITKKIGNDTVVIMTIRQAENINQLFDTNEKELNKISDSLKLLKSLLLDNTKKNDTLTYKVQESYFKIEEFKFKYEENKKIYLDKEKTYSKIHNNDVLQKVLFSIVLTFIAFKIH
jgi:hypothetical protein